MKSVVYTLYSSSPNRRDIAEVAQALESGALLIYPTDTVYAMGCLSSHAGALKKLEKAKQLSLEKAPLSFLFEDISALSGYVYLLDNRIFRLLKRTLPGPYAFLMETAQRLPRPFHKRKKIGVRITSHPILQVLLSMLSAPLVTTSLHHPDTLQIYPSDPDEILSLWDGKVDILLLAEAGGKQASTVVDLTVDPFEVVREGKGSLDLL